MTDFLGRLSQFVVFFISLGTYAGAWGSEPNRVQVPPDGVPVIAANAYLVNQVGGLERTNGDSSQVDVEGQPFKRAIHVTIRKNAPESNATQMTIPLGKAVRKGDVMFASLWLRGSASGGRSPAQIEFLFEKSETPWTKSVTQDAVSNKSATLWSQVLVTFQAADSYSPGEAMISLRFAFQPQTVEIGGLSVLDYGNTRSLDELVEFATAQSPIGAVKVTANFGSARQTLLGFGGDFCQPRYGSAEPMDIVGQYALDNLNVVHARVGFPLNYWNPQPGEFHDDAQAHAALLCLKEMTRRHIPTVLTIWEGPGWMLHGNPEESGRVLAPSDYNACIDAIVRYLQTARDKYGAKVDYFSFNEPDYGVNFKFTPQTMGDFIRAAGQKFKAAGLHTKFIVGDTAGGSAFHDFALPLLRDASIAEYLGPLGFHCWDGLSAPEASYQAIAELGMKYGKPIWCLEAGHDSALWQAPNPWGSWENALRTAKVYERTLRLTGASLMDYWTYQDNYPIVDRVGPKPYPVFFVLKQMEAVCRPHSRIVSCTSTNEALQTLVTNGPEKGRFAVLIVNSKGPGTVELAGLPAGMLVHLLLSNKSSQAQNLGTKKVSPAGTLSLNVPSRSVLSMQSN